MTRRSSQAVLQELTIHQEGAAQHPNMHHPRHQHQGNIQVAAIHAPEAVILAADKNTLQGTAKRLRNETVTVVETAGELLRALHRGDMHVEIQAHLNVTGKYFGMLRRRYHVVGPLPRSVVSIRVRCFACMRLHLSMHTTSHAYGCAASAQESDALDIARCPCHWTSQRLASYVPTAACTCLVLSCVDGTAVGSRGNRLRLKPAGGLVTDSTSMGSCDRGRLLPLPSAVITCRDIYMRVLQPQR